MLRIRAALAGIVLALVLPAPAATADTPADGPWVVAGDITAITNVLGSDTMWAIKTAGHPTLAAYEPRTGWTTYPVSGSATLTGLAVPADSDGWAIGNHAGRNGFALHWDGTDWSPYESDAFAPGDEFLQISASAPDNVWILGKRHSYGGSWFYTVWHWNGTTWEASTVWTGSPWHDIAAVSPTDAWLSGASDGKPTMLHWDGAEWHEMRVADTPGELTDLSAASAANVWATGTLGSRSITAHWDGSVWQVLDLPLGQDGLTSVSVAAAAGREARLIGYQPFRRAPARVDSTSGVEWSRTFAPRVCDSGGMASYSGIAVTRFNDVYLVGRCDHRDLGSYTLALRYDGRHWQRI